MAMLSSSCFCVFSIVAFLCSIVRSWCSFSVSLVNRAMISAERMFEWLCSSESLYSLISFISV